MMVHQAVFLLVMIYNARCGGDDGTQCMVCFDEGTLQYAWLCSHNAGCCVQTEHSAVCVVITVHNVGCLVMILQNTGFGGDDEHNTGCVVMMMVHHTRCGDDYGKQCRVWL